MEQWEPHIVVDKPDECESCASKDTRIAKMEKVVEAARELIETWERAEDKLPVVVPKYNHADNGWSQDHWLSLCKLNSALAALKEG